MFLQNIIFNAFLGHCSLFENLLLFQLRLGDMDLVIEVERDFTVYGDECKFGGGKVNFVLFFLPYKASVVKD